MSQVKTTAGVVEGMVTGAVTAWLGIPFAAPPVGDLRLRPPAPMPSWAGVRSAVAFGKASLQRTGIAGKQPEGTSEDCLFLNVWSPAADSSARPVLVWIHGGAYAAGSGALYDGAHLAALGDVVVVTINYRLGVLGFVGVEGTESNLGLRDQIAALRWVHENIAAFGGDPGRVTVAGESAGSVSVSLLMVAPTAKGLFHQAVMESGSYSLIHGARVHRDVAAGYATELGFRTPQQWRDAPAEQLLAAQARIDKAFVGTVAAAPWFDGEVVPDSLEAAQQTPHDDVALLAGHNHDEITLFQYLPGDILPTTRTAVGTRLDAALGREHADRVLATYADSHLGTRALATDFTFAMPTRHFAERHVAGGHPTFFYRFDAGIPVFGATHAAELPYLWNWSGLSSAFLRGRRTAAKRALADRLQQHWVQFVSTGNPGNGWPAFTLEDRSTLLLSARGDRIVRDPDSARRASWEGRDVMARS